MDADDEDASIQQLIMRTTAGSNFASQSLIIHIVPAKVLVGAVQNVLGSDAGKNYVAAAKRAANQIVRDCRLHVFDAVRDRRVILFCGMATACDAAAKQPGY